MKKISVFLLSLSFSLIIAGTALATALNLEHTVDTVNGIELGGQHAVYSPDTNRAIDGDHAFDKAVDNKGIREIISPIPEPAAIALLGLGLIGVTGIRRKKPKSYPPAIQEKISRLG